MQYRNPVLILLAFSLILGVASAPPPSPEPSPGSEAVPPPETEMEIGQNSSHIAWNYTHSGEFVNFTAEDKLQVFSANTSDNLSQPDNSTNGDNEDGEPEAGPGSSGGDGDVPTDNPVENVENSSDGRNTSENNETEEDRPENSTEEDESKGENLLPATFPEGKENQGLIQNITGQFSRSPGVLGAVFLAFGGLSAYIYKF